MTLLLRQTLIINAEADVDCDNDIEADAELEIEVDTDEKAEATQQTELTMRILESFTPTRYIFTFVSS